MNDSQPTLTEKNYSRFLSRKFLAAVFTLISASVLVSCGFIADGVYSAVIIATNTAYFAVNVVQKSTEK